MEFPESTDLTFGGPAGTFTVQALAGFPVSVSGARTQTSIAALLAAPETGPVTAPWVVVERLLEGPWTIVSVVVTPQRVVVGPFDVALDPLRVARLQNYQAMKGASAPNTISPPSRWAKKNAL